MYQKNFWNNRYSQEEFTYGKLPNEYLKEKLDTLKSGKILFPAEGEGRNAVYAAVKGWQSEAFDQSEEGEKKALLWASENNTEISYTVSNAENIEYPNSSFDALAMIYAHFPGESRRAFHRKLSGFLKPGGYLILEGFSKLQQEYQQRNPQSGGPRDYEMLYDLEELKKDFENFEIKEAFVKTIVLNEGDYHKGEASVVRIFAVKK
ncbi:MULTISPECIES: bifunctional 2-polyprenyl-6-hydroxyphenol methylase/3-demethylubiquinol 3-O-methyltransferase UbiG [Chryseobacterium group]|uniref:Methyltransferase domain-containing protein n=1 Tax=Epilithonimonas pallida TaxID=373671 RepID=A0ABY1R4K9_9FLAO|nr:MULTISPECIES: class I SAM-dependent methyltransferase [Chryseobacterium group]SMP94011.1 Methyltransferase domain-containing protein [Epilithonimonas pallida]